MLNIGFGSFYEERMKQPCPDHGSAPSRQGGFIQEKKNVKTLVLSLQPPSNEFGANSESSLK